MTTRLILHLLYFVHSNNGKNIKNEMECKLYPSRKVLAKKVQNIFMKLRENEKQRCKIRSLDFCYVIIKYFIIFSSFSPLDSNHSTKRNPVYRLLVFININFHN